MPVLDTENVAKATEANCWHHCQLIVYNVKTLEAMLDELMCAILQWNDQTSFHNQSSLQIPLETC